MRPKGNPVQIIRASFSQQEGEEEANTASVFELDEEKLEQILLNPNIQDKKVVVVSVAGAFRKGKSFLLDFFIRYLESKGKSNWLGDDESPLEGFTWRGGSDRETTGILLWSEPFTVELPTGDEVVVLLMDTQGAFDSESTVRDCATVFALSTMISSMQVFNITQNLQEDDLQHLQLFTEYFRLALDDNSTEYKPFQFLLFLVRDWSFPYEKGYGAEGGRTLLDRRLKISDNQRQELRQIREHIRSCFENIDCFLMPHPGLRVATDPHFDGQLRDIQSDFKEQVKVLVPYLLDKSKLVVKKINGAEVTCRGLVEYFKAYIKIYQGDELPEPRTILQATADANNLAAVSSSKSLYSKLMEEVCGGEKPYLHPKRLDTEHQRCRQKCVDNFCNTRKMGGSTFSVQYQEQLETDVDELYENFKKHNEGKNIFVSVKTPAVLFTVMVIANIFSFVFGLVGPESFANLFNQIQRLFLVLLCIWIYVRYSGRYIGVGQIIDRIAQTIWDKALKRVYTKVMQHATKQTIQHVTHLKRD